MTLEERIYQYQMPRGDQAIIYCPHITSQDEMYEELNEVYKGRDDLGGYHVRCFEPNGDGTFNDFTVVLNEVS